MHLFNEIYGDEVYVINVEADVQRMQDFEQHAQAHGLKFKRFNAVSPKTLVEEGFLGPVMAESTHPRLRAWVGRTACTQSHIRVVRQAKKPCMIFEDDARFKTAEADLRLYHSALPRDANFVLWSCGKERGSKWPCNVYWDQIGTAFWGLWSYAVHTDEAAAEYTAQISNVFGNCPDTALRSLGFGEPPSPLIVYAAKDRLITTDKSYASRQVFGTHKGNLRFDLAGFNTELLSGG